MKKFILLGFMILVPLFIFAKENLPNTQGVCPDCAVNVEGSGIPIEVRILRDSGGYNYVKLKTGMKIQISDEAIPLALAALTSSNLKFYFFTTNNDFGVIQKP